MKKPESPRFIMEAINREESGIPNYKPPHQKLITRISPLCIYLMNIRRVSHMHHLLEENEARYIWMA